MLDHIVEQARQQQIFCRERTAIEQRVLGAFLYHAGQSYRKITEFIDRSHVAIHDWYHRLAPLFEPDPGHHDAAAIDETKLFVEDREVYVWPPSTSIPSRSSTSRSPPAGRVWMRCCFSGPSSSDVAASR